MMTSLKPQRRWLQFSLRALLIFFLLIAIGMGWLSVKMHQAKTKREAVAAIEKAGGFVNYDYYEGSGPSDSWIPNWARAVFGKDFFFDAVGADAYANDFGDNGAAYLKELPSLEVLELIDTQVTDAGLKHLVGLTNLKQLVLTDTKVADAGLEHLTGLTNLELLDLSGTLVTDAGLKQLERLTKLTTLVLENTQVTDTGVTELKKALPSLRVLP